MKVFADGLALGQRGDEPVREVPRVRCHEAQTPDRRPTIAASQIIDRADEGCKVRATVQVQSAAGRSRLVNMGETRIRGQIVAVGVDVLAKERDLAIAGRGKRARLLDEVVERTTALGPATERHDAVGTRLVAAVDDRHPGRRG